MTMPMVQEWRDGLDRGELLIQVCESCDRPNMYPRYACPHCQSEKLGFTASSGRGRLHSFTVVRAVPPMGFEDDLPYALGVVKLEEGVQMLGRLAPGEDGDWSAYACDMEVEFVAAPEDPAGRPVAWFTPST